MEPLHACESDDKMRFANLCFAININRHVPLKLGLPLYGYIMPFIVAITVATNSFIAIVLSHKYLRTPTNYVLLSMSLTELLTGISSTPWLLYYYTFQGYVTDGQRGLSEFWCRSFPFFSTIAPTVFHTSAIWLTCYLAIQRYVYVCLNRTNRSCCGFKRTKLIITLICAMALISTAPNAFATYNQSYQAHPNATWAHTQLGPRRFCVRQPSEWVYKIGISRFYHGIYWFQAICVYALPCILLVVFTGLLVRIITNRRKRNKQLRNFHQRFHAGRANGMSSASISKPKCKSAAVRSTCSKGLKQNTRMLIVIIVIFLFTEVPAALIFVLHVLTVTKHIKLDRTHYTWMNTAVLLRNVLIVISYPLRFAIYCGMSRQFRMVARQMFSNKETLVVGDGDGGDGPSTSEAVTMSPDTQRQRSYTLVLVSVDKSRTTSIPTQPWRSKYLNTRRHSGYQISSSDSSDCLEVDSIAETGTLTFDPSHDTTL